MIATLGTLVELVAVHETKIRESISESYRQIKALSVNKQEQIYASELARGALSYNIHTCPVYMY